MKYLVTGGAGFIGSHLVDALLTSGNEVIVIDNLSTGKNNIQHHLKNEKLIFFQKDIRGNLSEIFENNKFDAVFHLAAIPSVPYSIEHEKETNDINLNGTLNILNLCKAHKVNRFIFSSSAAVYGTQTESPLKENLKPNPLSPYGKQKLNCESHCRLFFENNGIETIALRYFNVFGPRMSTIGDYAALIPKTIASLLAKEAPIIFGNGEQTRDFVYISEVINANLSALNTSNKSCFGEVFNIGSGEKISVNIAVLTLIKLTTQKVSPKYQEARKGDIKDSLAEISKAKNLLNWEPKVSFEQGMKETYEYFASSYRL
ncbi:MAG: GDP-mannose 4,6-dehydratase [Nanoarchaeota archaeon]